MELNLRKARKLESSIAAHVKAMKIPAEAKVRVLSSQLDRALLLESSRNQMLDQISLLRSLVKAKFTVRRMIAEANHSVGVNALMNKREELTALLVVSMTSLDVVNVAEMEDGVLAQKNRLDKGDSSYGVTTTLAVPVTTQEDLDGFKSQEKDLKKQLENVEDQLAQKNLGAKVTLDSDLVGLLTSAGLL